MMSTGNKQLQYYDISGVDIFYLDIGGLDNNQQQKVA
jgi:hypothetical protein